MAIKDTYTDEAAATRRGFGNTSPYDQQGGASSGGAVGGGGNLGGGYGYSPPADRGPYIEDAPPATVAQPPPLVAPDPNASNIDEDRSFQNDLIQQLHRLAMGDKNSAAQQSLRSGFNTARGNAQSLASLHRGFGGVGANAQHTANAQQQLTMQQGGNAAHLMAQQQQAAMQALQQAYGQMRAGDMGYANTLATGLAGANNLDNQFLTSLLGIGANQGSQMQNIGLGTAGSNLGLNNAIGGLNSGLVSSGIGALAGGLGSYFGGGGNSTSPAAGMAPAYGGAGSMADPSSGWANPWMNPPPMPKP